jgi:hypothetical protein
MVYGYETLQFIAFINLRLFFAILSKVTDFAVNEIFCKSCYIRSNCQVRLGGRAPGSIEKKTLFENVLKVDTCTWTIMRREHFRAL